MFQGNSNPGGEAMKPFRLKMLPPFRVAECTVWRVQSAEWNEFAEHVSFACAERFNPGRSRGLVIVTGRHTANSVNADLWTKLKSEYEEDPALLAKRIGNYLNAHPLFPFLYMTRMIDSSDQATARVSDSFLFHALALSGLFEWIWIHEPEEEEEHFDGRNDQPVCEQPLSMVF